MLMSDEFGDAYAQMVAGTQHIGALDGRTPTEALERGIPPRRIWEAVCAHMSVPEERRLGRDRPLRRRPIDE